MRLILIALIIISPFLTLSQTVIEMMHPGDANLVLLEVDNIKDADIVIFKTDDNKEAEEWDCKWKFKKWGFSNFSIYIIKDENDTLLFDEELGQNLLIQGKVFFTDKKEECGYVNDDFRLEGVFKRVKKKDTLEAN